MKRYEVASGGAGPSTPLEKEGKVSGRSDAKVEMDNAMGGS